jgi:LuxR family transcriptional regulator, maltose regulon positive regulatory protein
VEAQAGQGKSTLVRQYLKVLNIGSQWIRFCAGDRDTEHLVSTIEAGLNLLLPRLGSSAMSKSAGKRTPFDPLEILKDLSDRVNSSLQEDRYLVLDDLHLLLHEETSWQLVRFLIGHFPPRLHFILISRERLDKDLRHRDPERNQVRIGNRELALDEEETTELLNRVLHSDVTRETVRNMMGATEGWVAGLLLLARQQEMRGPYSPYSGAPSSIVDDKRNTALSEFFRHELFQNHEACWHIPLLLLAQLDVLPVALAEELIPDLDLHELARRNLFLRFSDPARKSCSLHPLFRQFLRTEAASTLSREEIRAVHRHAGTFWLLQDDPLRAIEALIAAEAYQDLEVVLERHGMSLLAKNRTAELAALLERIPEATLFRLAWAPFTLGLANMDSSPITALPMLDAALAVFSDRGDAVGELLCLGQIIAIHITTTGHLRDGEAALQRANQLFSRSADELDAETTILVARNLAMGYCIFLADFDEATRYASLALELSRKQKLVNFEASLLMVNGYIRIFAGHSAVARTFLEQGFQLLRHPEVGVFNRMSIRMMLFNFLFHEGDFANYFDQKNQLIEEFGSDLVAQSIAGPFCFIWEMDIAINQGRLSDGLLLAEQSLIQKFPLSPHLRSQILHLKAFILSRRGSAQAIALAGESLRLRDLSGGPYFIVLNKILAGHALVSSGEAERGTRLLDEGIEEARKMPTDYLEVCGRLHRAELSLALGRENEAREDIAIGLGLMHRNGYRHFWGWTPDAMQEIFRFAARNGIEAEYAATLAQERLDCALLDDGTLIPRLEIRTLGGLKVLLGSQPLLSSENLTPAQRELMGLLLSSPELKMTIDVVHLHLWPDSPPDTVKVNLDTLVSRLRKVLADALPQGIPQCYLHRGKGMLWLSHCRVDACEFMQRTKQGLKHLRLREHWQARNTLCSAESLWTGKFLPEIGGDERLGMYRDALTRTFSDLALAWSVLSDGVDRDEAGIRILGKAIRYDPFNEQLHARLYRIKGKHSAVSAHNALNKFAELLREAGYSPREIDGMLTEITRQGL